MSPTPTIEEIANAYQQTNESLKQIKSNYDSLNNQLQTYKSMMETKGLKGGEHYRSLLKQLQKTSDYLSVIETANEKYANLLKRYNGPAKAIGRFNLNQNKARIKREEERGIVRIMRTPAIISIFLGLFLLAFSQANLTGFAIGGRLVEVTLTFVLGFIFLILGSVLLLLVLRKQRKNYQLKEQAENKPAKKKVRAKRKAKKKRK
jgi:hypothetical protein